MCNDSKSTASSDYIVEDNDVAFNYPFKCVLVEDARWRQTLINHRVSSGDRCSFSSSSSLSLFIH